ncbi:MAG: flavohemoglobin expression-modulating QEGLA motif protein [Pseudomonadota bacterium]
MAEFSQEELARLEQAAALILRAEERLPVLRTLSWDRQLADRFFAAGETEPPAPEYPAIDATPSLELLHEAEQLVDGSSPVHHWLDRLIDTVEETAAMLTGVGTGTFYGHSVALYGSPTAAIADGKVTALDLARRLDAVLSEFDEASMRLEPPEVLSAEDVKTRMSVLLPEHFGDSSPRIEVTTNVSAKAAAGSDYIKLRSDASFSDLDVDQLLHHEALIHIATGYNGRAQHRFPILAESHPGNARTQEGLAVFAEFITGSLDPRRFKRLADRVIGIHLSAEGADFIELYTFFRESNPNDAPLEAFESARRVVRGGLVNGGGPCTKDSVYLGGLLEVHNFLRAAVTTGDPEVIRALFAGKMDLRDIDAVRMLLNENLIQEAAFLPPWAKDLRYLLSALAYSSFLASIDIESVEKRFETLLSDPGS